MSFVVTCEGCGKQYRVGRDRAGMRIPCKACGASMRVPGGRANSSEKSGLPLAVYLGLGAFGTIVIILVAFYIGKSTANIGNATAGDTSGNTEAEQTGGAAVPAAPLTRTPQNTPSTFGQSQPLNAAQPNAAANQGTGMATASQVPSPGVAGSDPASSTANVPNQNPPLNFGSPPVASVPSVITSFEPDYGALPGASVPAAAPSAAVSTPAAQTTKRTPYKGPDESWYGKPGFAIKLTREFELVEADEAQNELNLKWRLNADTDDTNLTMSFRYDARITNGSIPAMHNSGSAFSANGEMFYVTGGSIDRLQLGGVTFHRLTWPFNEGDRHRWVIVSHFDGMRLKFEGETRSGPTSIENRKMMDLVRTFAQRTDGVVTPTLSGFQDANMADAGGDRGFGAPSESSPAVASRTPAVASQAPADAAPPVPGAAPATARATDAAPSWGVTDPDRVIPYGDNESITFPRVASQFVLVGADVFSLATGEKTGSFPPETATGRRALSPSGTRMAMHSDRNGHDVPVVLVYALETPDAAPVRLVNDKEQKWLRSMMFLDDTKLIAFSGLSTDAGYVVWDTVTGKQTRSFDGEAGSHENSCLSSDGRYLAVADHRTVVVYDTVRGRLAARMSTLHNGQEMSLHSCGGLAFSPDMTELAGIFHDNSLVVWSAKGEVLLREVLPDLPRIFAPDFPCLYWLPDGSGWFVAGNTLLLRESMTVAWQLGDDQRPGSRISPSLVLDRNFVLTSRESQRKNELVVVPIPWTEIDAAVKGVDPSAKPLLGKGSSVSLKFQVGEVRFADKQTIVNDLTDRIRTRLNAAGISLAPNQPTTLHVTYSEKPGQQLRVSAGRFGFGQDTGQRVTDTDITATIEMRIDGQAEPLWKDEVTADASTIIDGDITEPNVRASAYKSALSFFERLAIPTRIANDPNHRLPIRTRL